MITRDEIRSIPRLHKSIELKRELIQYLQEKATSVPSGLSEGERVQTSHSNDAGKYVDASADRKRELDAALKELNELQYRAGLFIDTVEDQLTREVLRYRYIKCYSWEDTAELLGYQQRYVQKLEFIAVEKLDMAGHGGTSI